jgi:hypothetical protein
VRNRVFAYVVLGLNIIAAWISWWILASSIYGRTDHPWLFPILAFSFWAIFFALGCIFIKNRKYLFACYAVSAFGYLLFINPGWSYIAFPFTLLFLAFTEYQIKKESERGMTVDFYHLASHSLKYFVSIVCLVIAISYYFAIYNQASPSASGIESATIKTEIDWGLTAAGYVMSDENRKLAEDVRNNVTVDEFLSKNWIEQNVAKLQEAQNNRENNQNQPSDTAMIIGSTTAQQIKQEMLAKSKKDLSKQLGVSVVGEMSVKDLIAAYIDKTERNFFENSGSYKLYLPIILAFGLFLTARILGTAVDLLLGLVLLGIIKILLITNIVSIKKETREVGMIEYSI